MYARNDVINFHLSRGFYFRGSRSVRENRENLHPAKISRYTVYKSDVKTTERIKQFKSDGKEVLKMSTIFYVWLLGHCSVRRSASV